MLRVCGLQVTSAGSAFEKTIIRAMLTAQTLLVILEVARAMRELGRLQSGCQENSR